MKMLLICPSERPAMLPMSSAVPLAAVPLLGQGLVEYWLSSLAGSGATEVIVLAHDRPEEIRALVGAGERWGLTVSVAAESRELTPAQALLKYEQELGNFPTQQRIALMDHFPWQEQFPLFTNYADLFCALRQWLPNALTSDRVGFREHRQGVWVSTCASVSPQAELRPPCWIGRHALVGDEAVIGPFTMIEDEVLVEPRAEIVNSWVSGRTFVGSLARIGNSMAVGNTLINWQTGSSVEVPDPFLLCSLHQPRQYAGNRWWARLAELFARGREEPSLVWKHLVLNKES